MDGEMDGATMVVVAGLDGKAKLRRGCHPPRAMVDPHIGGGR